MPQDIPSNDNVEPKSQETSETPEIVKEQENIPEKPNETLLEDTESQISQINSLVTELSTVEDEDSAEIATLLEQVTDIGNEIQDIKRNELPMLKIEELTDQLALNIENLGSNDPRAALQIANNASSLQGFLREVLHNGMQDVNMQEDRKKFFELRDQRFPNVPKYATLLTNIEITAFDRISFENLTEEEKVRYVKLITAHYVYYAGLKDGSHHFNSHLGRSTNENTSLNDVIRDGTRYLSETEIREVDEEDKKIQKVHLNVPPNQRMEVLKAIASHNKVGGPIKSYKMRDTPSEPNGIADFIFYAQDSPEKTASRTRDEITTELYEILKPLNLPETTNIPRFSTPAVINKNPVSYLTVTQGNGDFKQYLSEHNPEILDALYDKTKNWAVRNNI